jgi:hypothetical protein
MTPAPAVLSPEADPRDRVPRAPRYLVSGWHLCLLWAHGSFAVGPLPYLAGYTVSGWHS